MRGTFLNPRSEYASGLDINLELLHWFDLIDFLYDGLRPTAIHAERRGAVHDVGLRYPGPMHARLRLGWEGDRRVRTLDLVYRDRQLPPTSSTTPS